MIGSGLIKMAFGQVSYDLAAFTVEMLAAHRLMSEGNEVQK
jgi:hypothetical protein